ncbi:hypothetical protein HSBAA_52930 [Vreelandella sulfidaeris]|uniref:Uncharacterized protein n=1 Tax=Vreelandella sulfidaeris TaxID=115553 RepID=A0A455UEC5_9GAMM|nr:hypothetical protein HSBAA_52930 [Halomonas sulfidaeris]
MRCRFLKPPPKGNGLTKRQRFARRNPLAMGSGLEPEYVERREVGDQTWLVVAADTGTVWPQLEEFVRSRQLNVLESSASQGVIVTPKRKYACKAHCAQAAAKSAVKAAAKP